MQRFLATSAPGHRVLEYLEPVRLKRDLTKIDRDLAVGIREWMQKFLKQGLPLSIQQVMGNRPYCYSFKPHRSHFPATVAALGGGRQLGGGVAAARWRKQEIDPES